MSINTYLFFNGNCEEAFKFYEKVLGGKIQDMLPHAGTPAESFVPPEWRDKIMHASMKIGDDLLMASDAPPQFKAPMQGFSVSVQFKDTREAERAFKALSEGGTVKMPLEETFWAARFGMLVDRFGTPWMVNCDKPA
jgi:PhnB protein